MNKPWLIPGSFQLASKYGDFWPVDIWLPHKTNNLPPVPSCLVAHSLGASWALKNYNNHPNCFFILVNPLIKPPRCLWLIYNWFNFLLSEGIPLYKLTPAKY